MTRNELERVLADHGYANKWHGTDCELWQKGKDILNLSNTGMEVGVTGHLISRTVPYELISVKDDKLIIHMEVEL